MAKFILSAFADEACTDIDDQIKALKENGISYIEPRTIGDKGILALTDEELFCVAKKLTDAGIKVNSLGSPIGKYNITDDFDVHLSLFKRAIYVCKVLGTDKMRMFSFYVDQSDLSKYRDEVMRRLQIMVDMAKKEGITLCHENESLIYGQMPDEVFDIMRSVDGIAAIFDPANYRMNDADVMKGIEATLINLAYLHIKDAEFATQTILPAGEGEGKIGEIINIVNEKTDVEVYLTLEPHLFNFLAYQTIDSHELKGKHKFNSNREAFDFAANALKDLLTEYGYNEVNGKWIK